MRVAVGSCFGSVVGPRSGRGLIQVFALFPCLIVRVAVGSWWRTGFAGEAGKDESASGDGDGDAERHGQEHDDDRTGERSDASDDELGEGEAEEHAGVVDR